MTRRFRTDSRAMPSHGLYFAITRPRLKSTHLCMPFAERFGWSPCEQTHKHAHGHQPKYHLMQRESQSCVDDQEQGAFRLAKSTYGVTAIQNPERNQVQRIEPCAGPG